jgi:hypothetical protein
MSVEIELTIFNDEHRRAADRGNDRDVGRQHLIAALEGTDPPQNQGRPSIWACGWVLGVTCSRRSR